jgi:hypothetical protein
MKVNYTTLKYLLVALAAVVYLNAIAATYKAIENGKFSDAKIWQPSFPGNYIKTGDSIIITSQVILNMPLAVEGVMIIEKGAALQGNKDISVAKTGVLNNKGNTVVNRLSNAGVVKNELVLETIFDIENSGIMNNSSTTLAGSSLVNEGGILDGNKGSYFSNDMVVASPNSVYGRDIQILQAAFATPVVQIDEVIFCDARLNIVNGNSSRILVELSSSVLGDLQTVSLEKSVDGRNYFRVAEKNGVNNTLILEDPSATENTLWYRIQGYDAHGKKYYFPETLVKIPNNNETLSMMYRTKY